MIKITVGVRYCLHQNTSKFSSKSITKPYGRARAMSKGWKVTNFHNKLQVNSPTKNFYRFLSEKSIVYDKVISVLKCTQ